jgi:SSS family solute:Na+ symporter
MELAVRLTTADILAIIGFLILCMGIGMFFSRKNKSSEDYFLAGRSMTWPIIGFSLFASNISSTTLIGLAGDAYATGISVFNYEWMAAFVLVFFCVFMLPFIVKSQVYTMPEYLERRYDHRVRMYFACLTLFLNIVVETAAALYAGSLVVGMAFPMLEQWQIIAILAVLAGAYTAIGGLSAVMIAETAMVIVLLVGSAILSYLAYDAIGGFHVIAEKIEPEKLSLIRPLNDEGVPWLGLVTGVPLLGFYFWCTNQFMVQRILAAKDVQHGRKGALMAGLLKLTVLFTMVLPGTAAILLYPDLERPDLVYPTLLFKLMPPILLGLVFAGFIGALLSAVDATLNSASTLVTMDIVKRFKPDLTSKQLMVVGKAATLVIMLLAVLWAPQIKHFDSLFKYLQTVIAYAVPPSASMFLVGAFWRRANAEGAFAAMIVGIVAGIVLFIANAVMGVVDIHFLYIVPILVILCVATLVVVSLRYPAPDASKTDGMVWTSAYFKQETESLKGLAWYNNYRVLSVFLLILTVWLVATYA